MICNKPITAFKPADGGPVSFVERKDHREIQIPCGNCLGCRLRRREEWALRCYCESKMHKHNHFLTLTYNDDNLPHDGSLNYDHFQLFMKRARKKLGSFRFFMCGEYGENTGRPHYHALFFGCDIRDLVRCNSVYAHDIIYKSEAINALWGFGEVRIGEVTYASARYCAAYSVKKVNGDKAEDHYGRVNTVTGEITYLEPEFAKMSLKPGIGETWLRKYWPDLYCTGHAAIVVNGQKRPIPRYFDEKMKEINPDVLEDHKFSQFNKAMEYSDNNTRERLEVREEVAARKQKFNRERSSHAL